MKVYVILEWVEEDMGGWHREYHSITADAEYAEKYRYDDDYEVVEQEV